MLRVLAVVVGIGFLIAADARACTCPPPPEPRGAMRGVDAVFSGEVTAIELVDEDNVMATIKVDRVWKGELDRTASVVTIRGESMCGYPFREGVRYLIYAMHDRHRPALRTDICTRTRLLENAEQDIAAVGPGYTPEQLTLAAARLPAGPSVYVTGSPAGVFLIYRGGLEGWDGTIERTDDGWRLVNDVFLEVLGPGGEPMELRRVEHVRREEVHNERIELLLPISQIADLSADTGYILRWGVRGVAEREMTIRVVDPWMWGRAGGVRPGLVADDVRVQQQGEPVLVMLRYQGGIEGWDGAIERADGELRLVNNAFLHIFDRQGKPMELRDVTYITDERRRIRPFSVVVDVTQLADLSEPGLYRMRWGAQGVVEHDVFIRILTERQLRDSLAQ